MTDSGKKGRLLVLYLSTNRVSKRGIIMQNRILMGMSLSALLLSNAQVLAEDKNKSVITAADVFKNQDITVDAKVRCVHMFTAMGEADPGKIERKNLEQKTEFAKQELQEEAKALQKASSEYMSKATTMSEKARENEEKRLMKLDREAKAHAAEKNEEINLEMQIATETLAKGVEEAVIQIAKEDNVDLVFDTMGRIIYVSDAFDITNKVIDRVNKNYEIVLAQNKQAESAVRVADNKAAAAKPAKVSS